MDLIKSYRANRNWIKAHALMGGQFQSLALIAIQKAIDLEPDIKKLPGYLELQGHIENSLGKRELALKSFMRAKEIIAGNANQFTSEESKKLYHNILESIDEIKTKKT